MSSAGVQLRRDKTTGNAEVVLFDKAAQAHIACAALFAPFSTLLPKQKQNRSKRL